MLRIDQIRLLPGDSEELLRGKCAKLLRVPTGDVTSCTVMPVSSPPVACSASTVWL